jgi:hypothetical protein
MHLTLMAAEQFYSTHQRWPGASAKDDMAKDLREMEATVKAIVSGLMEEFQELEEGYIESIVEV